MPCNPFLGGFICTRRTKPKAEPCFVRDCRGRADVACDWFLKQYKPGQPLPPRCSRPCCRNHSRHVDVDKDLCLEHALRYDKVKAEKSKPGPAGTMGEGRGGTA